MKSLFGARDLARAKLKKAREDYHRRYVRERQRDDAKDPIYHAAELARQSNYRARKKGAE